MVCRQAQPQIEITRQFQVTPYSPNRLVSTAPPKNTILEKNMPVQQMAVHGFPTAEIWA
jgi:hypothetical protein